MPNAIKYNTSAETLSLNKGNFWIGTGDIGKGPTSTTGFYNGITPPSGGYTIYLNKATGGPSIYTCANDTELISLTNQIAGTSYTTKNESLNYFYTQNDKIIINNDYPPIITDGLVRGFDTSTTLSYPQNGSAVYDLKGDGSYVPLSSGGNPSWSNDISNLTICCLITKTHTDTGYANHPINKWNTSYNVNASFILYHFENYQGNGQDGKLGWYAYGTNVGWFGHYGFTTMSVGQTFWVALQFNSTEGMQPWVNGNKAGGRSGNVGTLGRTTSTTYNMQIYMPYEGSQIGTGYISHILFYDRELTDAEMVQNYNAVSSRVVV